MIFLTEFCWIDGLIYAGPRIVATDWSGAERLAAIIGMKVIGVLVAEIAWK